MKRFPFKKIDAFATERSAGNPAGYVALESVGQLSPAEMQRIAAELAGFVSEVGFAVRLSDEAWDLRYYSAEREVDFCGHATVAIMHDLLRGLADASPPDDRSTQPRACTIRTKRGNLPILDRIAEEDAVYVRAPAPEYRSCSLARADIARHLGVDVAAIDPVLPVSIINAGLTTLLVPIVSLEAILSLAPVLADLRAFCLESHVDIVEVFTPWTSSEKNAFRVRVFAPTFGYLEDPATGSGNSAFGYYLLKAGRWDGRSPLSLEQNGDRERFNVVRLITDPASVAASSPGAVYFGGRGACRIDGSYYLT
jgi:PhzF family phenazine biosynthesis protein